MKNKKAIFRWLILAISVLFLLMFLNSSKETSVIKQLGAKIFKTKAENSTEDITIPRLNINGDGILDLATKATTLDVTAQFEGSDEVYYATLKLQGTSSLSYEKKNYTINFYKDETYSSKKKIDLGYGWGKESKYCLKANWIDSTQARNIVSARLAAQMQKKYGLFEDTPNNGLIDGHFVEIYINGEYRGLYTLNIPKDDWMFNMNKNNENHIVMCAENPNKGSSTTFEATSSTVDGEDWSIEVGPNGSDEEVQATFAKLNRVINFVKDSTNEEFKTHFSEYLNLDATLNYYCFMALSNAVDNMNKNMLFVTYDGQVWYPSLYDLDTTWGLWFNGEGLYSFTNKVTDYGGGSSLLFKKLVECYPNELQARYTELRETVLSNENIINEFEKFINSAPAEAWKREQTKWPNIPSKQYGIDQIKEHVLKRGNYIDSVMEQLVIESKTYEDSRILYQLDKEYIGGPYKFLDTGINLYNDETNPDGQDYTIFARFKSNNLEGFETIFAQRDQLRNGIVAQTSDDNDSYTVFYAGNSQYEALFGDNGSYTSVAIKKEGSQYYIYRDNINNVRIRPNDTEDKENFTVDSQILSNLILGASYYYDSANNIITEGHYNGTISNFVVYNAALSEDEISTKLTELSNIRSSLTDVKYEGDVKSTFAPGQNFNVGNAKFTAIYEDGTTLDVTNNLVFTPKKITKDTTEIKVSYTENTVTKEFIFPITVKEYSDSRILYELEEEFVGDGQSYINTGVSLYENGDNQNYTVLVRYKIGESSADTTPFSDTKDSINKGIDIFIPSDGTWSGIYAGNANYESLYGDSKSKYAVAIIKKEGTNYYYYLDNVTNTRTLTDKPIDSAFSEEAIIGAVRNTTTTMTNYFTGTISNCIIYNEALNTEEITTLMEEYTSYSNSKLSKIELTASPEVKQYAEGSKFKTTGMIITATYEDQTTKDVTSKITVEPEVLTLDTTEVEVTYEENKISKTLTIPVKVIKYEDSRILYELEEEFIGDGQSYINTGVSLYENGDNQNYTVLVRYKIGESSADTTPFSDTKDSINKGIDIFIPSDGTWSGIYAGNANYESLYGDSKSKYAVAIIKKEGTNYYYYLDNVTNTRTLTDKPIDSAFSEEAIIGAVRNTTTTMTNYFTGTVSNCIIYNEALSTEEITTLMEKYTSLSNSKLSKIEISTLPTKTKYFSGDKLDLTGLKVIATYEDGSTEDVTDKIEVENDVISKDVTEIKLLYTENRITKETSYPITVVMAEKYIKNASVSKRITGTAPFDVDNRAGNDSSADNRIIRSFDKIEYSVRLEFSVNDDQNFDDGNIYIHAELPEDCANVARWDIEETAWITSSNATLSEDGRILDAIYEMESKQNTQGIQNLTFIIEVLGAKNGTEFKPSFKFWLNGNQTDPTNPDYNVCEMTPSENVLVSSKPAYNLALTQNPVLSAKTTVELDGKQQSGRMYGYSLILQLYNNDEAKGLKGIEIPKGDVTFDINMLMSKIKDSTETDITDVITPVLWNYKINTITGTGKIADRSMKINGIECTDFGYTSAPLGEYGDIQPEESVYNSGDINITQSENKLSVTISDYIIKNIFPKSGYFSGTHLYPNNVGCFSAGYIQIFVKDDNELIDENSEYYLTLQAQNVKFTSLSDKSITVQANTDDEIKTRYYYLKPGDYSNWLALTKKDTDEVLTPNAAMQGGYSLRDEEFAVRWFIKLNETNDDETNINSADGLLKFDADAIIPTGTMNYTSTSNTSDMKFKLYYATKKDGTNWNNQTEMINSNFDDLNYYDSIDKIPSNEVCVAIYVESYDGHLKQGDSILKFGFKTSTQATIGKTYVITKDLYMYKDKLDRTIYTRTSPTENYPEATYQQANETFIPGSYDEEGNLTEGTGSYVGQTLLIIGANQSAPISVKEDEAGNIKTVYNLGKNENIVKFKITPSITNTKAEEIGTTTLTITSYLPEGLEYVEGSTNYENVKVENVTRNGSTYTKLTWNIYEAKVNQSLDEITYEARISNKTANNKKYTVESSISGDSNVIGNIIKNEREYSTTISIVNLEAHVFYKETDTSVVERNSQIHYILSYKNNTSEDVNDFRILDILPYNGDNRGSNFSGSYTVDKISVTTSSSQNINIYVSNDENARNIESISEEDLTGSSWSKLTSETNGTYNVNSNETAIIVDGGIDASSDIIVDVYITPAGNESGDKYVNMAKTSVENLTSSSATSVVVYRKISGVVWFDKNGNGIMDSDEERMSNVKLSLLKSSNEKAVDAYGNEVLDTYTDEKGCYSFEKLSKGEYIVVITLNDEYELTLKEVGTNNSINSKFNTTNNTSNTITRLNYLNDAVLNEEDVNAGVVFTTKIKVIEVNEKHPELRPDVKVYLGQKDALGNLNNIESIVLNNSNDYTYTWNNLAKYFDDGTEIEYVVTQDVPADYYQYSLTKNEDTFTIINYKLGQIQIIAEDNDGNRLEGATFVLKNSNDEIVETLVTSSSGIITYSSLKHGEYILTETAVPQGYSLQKSNLSIVIDEDNIDYIATIKHSLKTILPNTGKFDTIYMIILQIVLMGGGIKFLSVNKHKKVPKHQINKRRR